MLSVAMRAVVRRKGLGAGAPALRVVGVHKQQQTRRFKNTLVEEGKKLPFDNVELDCARLPHQLGSTSVGGSHIEFRRRRRRCLSCCLSCCCYCLS